MEKVYTKEEYRQKAIEANSLDKFLYRIIKEVEYLETVLEWEDEEQTIPKMVKIEVPVYDENGEQIGVKFEKVQASHEVPATKQVEDLEINEIGYYVLIEDNLTDGTIADLAEARKQEFLKIFFKIDGHGYFRKQPKGYGSAVESLNTAFNIVTVIGKLPAETLTFYPEPDFTKPEQCTEEWLVANATKNEEMTPSEFGIFYAKFITGWNEQEHL